MSLGNSWPNESLTVPLVEFVVYWTPADIDRKVEGIPLTQSHSKAVTGAVPSLVGRTGHYQRLLSARSARDALQNRSNGGTRR